jgi:hypothetical protein
LSKQSAYNALGHYSTHLRTTVKTLAANGVNPMEIVRECKRLYPDLRVFRTQHVRLICLRKVERRETAIRPISLAGPIWSIPEGVQHWTTQKDEDQRG